MEFIWIGENIINVAHISRVYVNEYGEGYIYLLERKNTGTGVVNLPVKKDELSELLRYLEPLIKLRPGSHPQEDAL